MFSETFCVTVFIIFNMSFAVIIGKCVYNFLCVPVMPVEMPSVKFVSAMLPQKATEVRFMVHTLIGVSGVLFIATLIFVLFIRDMFLFKSLCILGILSIFYFMLFIHTMKRYEVSAMEEFRGKYEEYLKERRC